VEASRALKVWFVAEGGSPRVVEPQVLAASKLMDVHIVSLLLLRSLFSIGRSVHIVRVISSAGVSGVEGAYRGAWGAGTSGGGAAGGGDGAQCACA
jgi:hypothetical protein